MAVPVPTPGGEARDPDALPEVGEPRLLAGAVVIRLKQRTVGTGQRLAGRVTEQIFGPLVPAYDDAVQGLGDDAVTGTGHDGGQPGLFLNELQTLLLPLSPHAREQGEQQSEEAAGEQHHIGGGLVELCHEQGVGVEPDLPAAAMNFPLGGSGHGDVVRIARLVVDGTGIEGLDMPGVGHIDQSDVKGRALQMQGVQQLFHQQGGIAPAKPGGLSLLGGGRGGHGAVDGHQHQKGLPWLARGLYQGDGGRQPYLAAADSGEGRLTARGLRGDIQPDGRLVAR